MARSDMFLKLTGKSTGEIKGESSAKGYEGQIDVIDWSWGMAAPSAVGGQRTGRVQFKTLNVVKLADRASTALMSVMRGNELLTAVLTVRKAAGSGGGLPYFTMELKEARVDGYDLRSTMVNDAPVLVENLSFSFRRITNTYTPQGTDGGAQGSSSFEGEAAPSN